MPLVIMATVTGAEWEALVHLWIAQTGKRQNRLCINALGKNLFIHLFILE